MKTYIACNVLVNAQMLINAAQLYQNNNVVRQTNGKLLVYEVT